MSYSGQTWVDGAGGGTPVSAARLNILEGGAVDASNRLNPLELRVNAVDGISNVGNVGATQTLTAGGGNGTAKLITLTAATCTLTLAVGGTEIRTLELVITQDATGGRLITWPASVKWPSGTPPVLSTAGGSVDRVTLRTYDAGTTWYGQLVGKGYA